jgi:UDP-N-acetylmuramoyl-L-alanyl-D-glutamate--2,6-diaminopimelate ligase
MARDTRADVLTFGSRPSRPPGGTRGGSITYEIVENSVTGLRLRLDGLERRFRLCGGFNAQNLAAAYAGLRALGFQQGESLDALAESTGAPGRIEILRPPAGEGPFAVVDYAHNPDGLEATLRSVRQLLPTGARLFLVFGCGGNRDKAKRPVMGDLASRLADEVILTDDNPRWEDPERILGEIRDGMSRPPLRVVRDREAAIRFALETAGPRDIVLVAGKGHERYQQVGSERSHFDDREVVRKLQGVLPRTEGDPPAH